MREMSNVKRQVLSLLSHLPDKRGVEYIQ